MWSDMPATKKAKGSDGKGWATMAQDDSVAVGEVRFVSADDAQTAIQRLNGQPLLGSELSIEMDPRSSDFTKLIVWGIPSAAQWQEVKDHFGQCGKVAYADIRGGGRKGRTLCGEVRFDDPTVTAQALEMFNGSELQGVKITVTLDPHSKDYTKLLVSGLPAGCGWQDLKDHFANIGTPVAYCQVRQAAGNGRGEVRFNDPTEAQIAVQTLNGSELMGHIIAVEVDPMSFDGTRLKISGLNPGAQWQELKDHFSTCGQVAFAEVKAGGKGKGADGKFGGKGPGPMKGGAMQGGDSVTMPMQMMQQMLNMMQQMQQMQQTMQMNSKGKGGW